jgi:hypothetical protein
VNIGSLRDASVAQLGVLSHDHAHDKRTYANFFKQLNGSWINSATGGYVSAVSASAEKYRLFG